MMYGEIEALDGIQYAIQEIDEELTSLIPKLKKRECTPRVMAEVDFLLDTRIDLLSIAEELNYDEYNDLMTS